MKTNDFFNILLDKTKDIPESKLEEIISYYKVEIFKGLSSGKSEEEIIENFGDINIIVYDLNNNYNKFILNKQPSSNPGLLNDNNANILLPRDLNNSNKSSTLNINYALSNINLANNKTLSKRINKIFKFIIALLIMIIILPLAATILAFILGLFGLSLGVFFGSIGILIDNLFFNFTNTPNLPLFLVEFPKNALIFLSLGSISLSGLAILSLGHVSKFLVILMGKFFIKYKRKGGI